MMNADQKEKRDKAEPNQEKTADRKQRTWGKKKREEIEKEGEIYGIKKIEHVDGKKEEIESEEDLQEGTYQVEHGERESGQKRWER